MSVVRIRLTTLEYNLDIAQWLDDNAGVGKWSCVSIAGDLFHFYIADPDTAMLFKLTWSGVT